MFSACCCVGIFPEYPVGRLENTLEKWHVYQQDSSWALFCGFQGIDIRHNKDRKVHRTEPKSEDIYLRLLVKVSVFFHSGAGVFWWDGGGGQAQPQAEPRKGV